jgi:hypothetical protein
MNSMSILFDEKCCKKETKFRYKLTLKFPERNYIIKKILIQKSMADHLANTKGITNSLIHFMNKSISHHLADTKGIYNQLIAPKN